MNLKSFCEKFSFYMSDKISKLPDYLPWRALYAIRLMKYYFETVVACWALKNHPPTWDKADIQCPFQIIEYSLFNLRLLQASWTFDTILKGYRSFNAENLGSVDQRASSYRPSNFEKDLTLGVLEWRPGGLSGAGAGRQTFSWDLQIWKLVTLKPFNLQILFLQN